MNLHEAATLPSLQHHGYPIVEGVLKEEAIELLRSFYDRENFHAPDDKRKRKPAAANKDNTASNYANFVKSDEKEVVSYDIKNSN